MNGGRPKCWEEIKKAYTPNYPQLFEAGADAMLEALSELKMIEIVHIMDNLCISKIPYKEVKRA